MMRRFVTLDGEVEAEEEWDLNPTVRCFYCNQHLVHVQYTPCPIGFSGQHDYVTLIQR